MTQTTAPQVEMTRAFAGMVADGSHHKSIKTAIAAAAALAYGKFVSRDTANGEDAAKLPATSDDVTVRGIGIIASSHSLQSSSAGDPQYPQNDAAPYLEVGEIFVETEDAVTVGDPVFVRFQSGNEGGFRSDVDGGNAVQLPNARYASTTTGAGLVKVNINLPG